MPPELLFGMGIAVGLLVGATGTWSPCGLSMIETIGPAGHSGGKPTTAAAIATFVPGALVGGALTFGGLAWLAGLVLGSDSGAFAYGAAALIALAAAWAEFRGVPIVPQVRRQLPEHWRRMMPMPVAAGLYGILLGLGFTTFVLTFGVWALAGVTVAMADPLAGVVLGLAFGVGRAVPIAVLAPLSDRPFGLAAKERMTQSRTLYSRFRTANGIALAALAAGFVVSGPAAGAATVLSAGVGDADVSDGSLVAQRDSEVAALVRGEPLGRGGAVIRRDDKWQRLRGSIPAIGGPYVALRRGRSVLVLDRESLEPVDEVPGARTDALAVGHRWLIERVRTEAGDRLSVRRIDRVGNLGGGSVIARINSPGQLGSPSLAGDRVYFTRSGRRASRVGWTSLSSGRSGYLLASRMAAFSGVDVKRRLLAYVRVTSEWQEVRLMRLDTGATRVLGRIPVTSWRDPDHEQGRERIPTMDRPPSLRRVPWSISSIALAPKAAYVTLLAQPSGAPRAKIKRIPR